MDYHPYVDWDVLPTGAGWIEWDRTLERLVHLECIEFGVPYHANVNAYEESFRLTAPPKGWELPEVLKKRLPIAHSRGVLRLCSEIQ